LVGLVCSLRYVDGYNVLGAGHLFSHAEESLLCVLRASKVIEVGIEAVKGALYTGSA
jgi:hypothetical protein